MLAGSKLLVGNRFARAFVAAYAVLLHLFIMVRKNPLLIDAYNLVTGRRFCPGLALPIDLDA
jgi:hypothetical protein